MYQNGYSEKCVRAICRMVGLVHRDVRTWLQLSSNLVNDNFSHEPRQRKDRSLRLATNGPSEPQHSEFNRDAEEVTAAPI
jgi:hypothetical protein